METMSLLEGTERFVLTRLQLINWGTFSGIHDIPISPKGHLFVGASGSGKSTLLDAMSTLLSPRSSNFNAAARQGEKKGDRNFVSYIRGAWSSEQDTEGRAVSKFLRPDTTFSAVSMTFKSAFETEVTFLFLGWIQGKSKEESSVRKHYFAIREPFNIAALKDFGTKGMDLRLIKERFASAESFKSFSAYAERFMEIFNIRSVKVLELLHKAQSAKNMGDINRFFRDFMLVDPKTFSIADSLVTNFTTLKKTYEDVKEARLQYEVLSAAKAQFERAAQAAEREVNVSKLIEEVDSWRLAYLKDFSESEVKTLASELQEVEQKLEQSINHEQSLRDRLEALRLQRVESGGGAIERLQLEKKRCMDRLSDIERFTRRLESSFKTLSVSVPKSFSQWNALTVSLRAQQEEEMQRERDLKAEEENLVFELRDKDREYANLKAEIKAMQDTRSNLPSALLAMRTLLADRLNLKEHDLPFVGELLEVRNEEKEWQGAIERVLRQFSSSLLIKDEDYAALARFADSTNLRSRLVYYRVRSQNYPFKRLSEDSLPKKLIIKPGSWAKWLEKELAERFCYECVASTAQFGAFEKAVTLAGQVKHNKSRHEKNDRSSITDKSEWVTGFSNEEKIAELEKRAEAINNELSGLQQKKSCLDRSLEKLYQMSKAVEKVLETDWKDIDRTSVKQSLAEIEKQLAEFEEKSDVLRQLSEAISEKEKELNKAVETVRSRTEKKGEKKSKLESVQKELDNTVEQLSHLRPNPLLQAELTRRYSLISDKPVTKAQLGNIARRLTDKLSAEQRGYYKEKIDAESAVCQQFQTFCTKWKAAASELDATLKSAPEFFHKLEILEKDGLPKYEHRFKEVLERDTRQNLIDLLHEIEQESREIKSRMREVNESLAEAVFNRTSDGDTHLIIDVKDLKLPEYLEFRREANEIISVNPQTFSLSEAEKYFAKLERLIDSIKGESKEQALLREKALDARQHVSFQGREVNQMQQTVDVYDSGSGKSGGQRQKLTLTCLLAALRYQLGSRKSDEPSFAPVIMDEAFDKADSEFTDISLKLFSDFGFQPILATPLKGILTLEPYIGSFAYVDCTDRRISAVAAAKIESIKEKLRNQ